MTALYDNLVEVDRATYYGKVWPEIHRQATTLQSNFKTPTDECFPPLAIIHWGLPDPVTGAKRRVAVVWSDGEGPDRYWTADDLI